MLLSSLYLSRKKSQYSKMQRTAHSHLQVLLPVLHYQIPSPLHHEPKYKHPHTLHGKSVKFTIPIHFFHPWTNFFIIPYFIRTVNTRLIRIKVKFLRLCLLYLVKNLTGILRPCKCLKRTAVSIIISILFYSYSLFDHTAYIQK